MGGMRPKRTLRFATVLVALPLYLGGINYCLFGELARLSHCADGECTEHQDGATHPHQEGVTHQHQDGARGAPTSGHPAGTAHPCCTTLVGVVVPKVIGPTSSQLASSDAILAEASATMLPSVSWNDLRIILKERPSPSLHRCPSAPRAPPLS